MVKTVQIRRVVEYAELTVSLAAADDSAAIVSAERQDMPLTAALLAAASGAISFATPGHRNGRSCTLR